MTINTYSQFSTTISTTMDGSKIYVLPPTYAEIDYLASRERGDGTDQYILVD